MSSGISLKTTYTYILGKKLLKNMRLGYLQLWKVRGGPYSAIDRPRGQFSPEIYLAEAVQLFELVLNETHET